MTSYGITTTSVVRRDDEAITEILDGEAVIYHEGRGSLHVLSTTATVIWDNLDGQLTVEGLAAALSDAFGAPLDVVRHDTLETVRSFAEQGLLEGSAAPAAAHRGGSDVTGDEDGAAPRFLRQPPHG